MILSFAKNTVSTSFEKGCIPRLLTASNITVGFSQHPRILHNHDDRMELLYIRTGSGSYIVGDECYDIRPGNIIVCNPGILHDELPEHNRHLSMLSLAVTDLTPQKPSDSRHHKTHFKNGQKHGADGCHLPVHL